jgi:transcriptional regulator with XRE-family HTH domain
VKKINVTPELVTNLVRARNAKGLSQTALGEAIGKGRGIVAALETHKLKSVKASDLKAMEEALGVASLAPSVATPAAEASEPEMDNLVLLDLAGGITIAKLAEHSGRSITDIVEYAMHG